MVTSEGFLIVMVRSTLQSPQFAARPVIVTVAPSHAAAGDAVHSTTTHGREVQLTEFGSIAAGAATTLLVGGLAFAGSRNAASTEHATARNARERIPIIGLRRTC